MRSSCSGGCSVEVILEKCGVSIKRSSSLTKVLVHQTPMCIRRLARIESFGRDKLWYDFFFFFLKTEAHQHPCSLPASYWIRHILAQKLTAAKVTHVGISAVSITVNPHSVAFRGQSDQTAG
jgi:hypothetical protein